MCKIGDIVLVYDPIKNGKHIGMHSFVVLDDTGGNIRSVNFDFIGLLMSSMDTQQKREKLMKYDGNFPLTPDEQIITSGGNGKSACVKADQFYYFNKNEIRYRILGSLDMDIFNLLIEFIQEIGDKGITFEQVIDNT
jgi:hypothetical protein